ncbi:hypothetical protein MRB53_040551 [Persea americana]|nr:hypothetical protein MRB53_040551 [Persea americana]
MVSANPGCRLYFDRNSLHLRQNESPNFEAQFIVNMSGICNLDILHSQGAYTCRWSRSCPISRLFCEIHNFDQTHPMRLPSVNILLRTIHTLGNITQRYIPSTQYNSLTPLLGGTSYLRNSSMPSLSSWFGTSSQPAMSYPLQKSKQEWQAQLSRFRVVREKGTEAPYTGKYDQHFPAASGPGVYNCVACDAPLYKANHKFKSGCGWPAFFDAIPGAVVRHTDRTFGMERTEIVCANCGGHLGHVFKGEGYATPTDERHCVNSVSLNFVNGDGEAKAKA